MASLLGSFTGMAQTTVVPMIFKFIETQEPMLEEALITQLNSLKTSNPNQFNIFLTNWRKINNAIETSSRAPVALPQPVQPVAPTPVQPTGGNEPVSDPVPVADGTRKYRRHKKRTHKVKHRKH
jgi:hypothetical protein